MHNRVRRVLIVTSDSDDAKSLQDAMSIARDGIFSVEIATGLAEALVVLAAGGIDTVLTDLNLSDSSGVATLDRLLAVVPAMPVIIFTEPGSGLLAIAAVRRGARGFLPKGEFSSALITASLIRLTGNTGIDGALSTEKSRAETTLDSISDAVITTDIHGNIDYLNQAAATMTGWTQADALGCPIAEVMPIFRTAPCAGDKADDSSDAKVSDKGNGSDHAGVRRSERNPVELVLKLNEPMAMRAGTVLVRRDGSEVLIEDSAAPILDAAGQLCGAVMVFHDISATKALMDKMAHLAQHDFLTDLPNRLLLQDRISQAIELAARHTITLAVFCLDLDNFKVVNDRMGHDAGDKLLRSVARRLSACVRSSDTVSRYGGDEFILLILDDDKTGGPAAIAAKILLAMAASHPVDGESLIITTSIGISLYPADGSDAASLIKNADLAMYAAKARGRNNYQFYGATMPEENVR